GLGLAVVVLDVHRRAEEYLVLAALLLGVHDHRRVEALAQPLQAPVDLAQLLLAVDVLRVLRAVAEGGGVRDLVDDARPVHHAQLVRLLGQLAVAEGRDVVRHLFHGSVDGRPTVANEAAAGYVPMHRATTRVVADGSWPPRSTWRVRPVGDWGHFEWSMSVHQ